MKLQHNMHSYLSLFGINNGMEFVFSIFWIFLNFFAKSDICINTYKFCLIVTSHVYYVYMFCI
jgi:hypothetical protein